MNCIVFSLIFRYNGQITYTKEKKMKKIAMVLVLLLVTSTVFANPIQLGTFPIGRWLDPNWNAIWEFTSNNIRILSSTDGTVLYDFSSKTIRGFRVFLDGTQPGITFTCPEAGRTYRFIARLPSTNVVMEITREGLPNYSVTMQRQ